ncbi:MAG: hypothetical protein ACRC2U_17135, partial [Aeromonas sp.]
MAIVGMGGSGDGYKKNLDPKLLAQVNIAPGSNKDKVPTIHNGGSGSTINNIVPFSRMPVTPSPPSSPGASGTHVRVSDSDYSQWLKQTDGQGDLGSAHGTGSYWHPEFYKDAQGRAYTLVEIGDAYYLAHIPARYAEQIQALNSTFADDIQTNRGNSLENGDVLNPGGVNGTWSDKYTQRIEGINLKADGSYSFEHFQWIRPEELQFYLQNPGFWTQAAHYVYAHGGSGNNVQQAIEEFAKQFGDCAAIILANAGLLKELVQQIKNKKIGANTFEGGSSGGGGDQPPVDPNDRSGLPPPDTTEPPHFPWDTPKIDHPLNKEINNEPNQFSNIQREIERIESEQ